MVAKRLSLVLNQLGQCYACSSDVTLNLSWDCTESSWTVLPSPPIRRVVMDLHEEDSSSPENIRGSGIGPLRDIWNCAVSTQDALRDALAQGESNLALQL